MQNNLVVFENEEFGKVRVVNIDGVPWFVGNDVAGVLGYSNARKALVDHVDTEDKGVTKCDTLALKKDATETPPRWLVFFKSRDADALTAAFKEFSASQLKRTTDKSSLLENLRNMAVLVKNQVVDKVKNKDKGREL